mmetsp:Transcript_4561/g.16615  ORF Transcript_4561/g.16615 Transcript_4561/m.16615 type:complete len:322 (+) Transcript_4561:413-1378(+)
MHQDGRVFFRNIETGAVSYEAPRQTQKQQKTKDIKGQNIDDAKETMIHDIYMYDDDQQTSKPGRMLELEDHLSEAIWNFDEQSLENDRGPRLDEHQEILPVVNIGSEELSVDPSEDYFRNNMIDDEANFAILEHTSGEQSIVSSNLFEKKRIDNQGPEMFESIYNHIEEDAHNTEKHSYKKLKMCMESNRPILRNVPVDPVEREFCYVDEHTCIGCTNCAMIARSTFFMEESHGRARVFLQDGDSASAVEEAINSCPVDCIHPVTFQELQELEDEGDDDTINNKSRLVGGAYTAHDKGGTPWLRLLARRKARGESKGILGF